MLELKQAVFEDAQAITAIKVRAYNREINTYLHRDGGPEGYDSVDSQRDILRRYPVWRIELDGALIGALFVAPQKGGAMRLEDFVIDPAHRAGATGGACWRCWTRFTRRCGCGRCARRNSPRGTGICTRRAAIRRWASTTG